ncbi:MAG TPA: hypothetical protein VHC69_24575 [Polyangiaceae bacterium]|nr:hypothetical protein [Polyangiaceae bacterium]
MQDFIVALIVATASLVALRGRLQRYTTPERSLLQLSLWFHIGSAALLVPFMKGPLKGGDMLVYDEISRALLDRLVRAPGDTLGILGGLLLHANDPLPVPDYGLAFGSSGSMIALTTFSLLFTWRSLPAACVLIGVASFFAKVRIYDVFRAETDARLHRRIIAATMLVPSTIFWSSGLIKEAFATIGLGLVFKELYHWFYRRRLLTDGLVAAAIGLALLATTKAYVFVPLGLAAAASMLLVTARQRRWRLGAGERAAAIILGIGIVLAAGRVSSQYDPANFVAEAAHQQDVGAQLSYAGSYYSLTTERSFLGQIVATPLALVTALFRPFIFEARNVQQAANGLETLYFAFLATRAFRHRRAGYRMVREQPLLMFCSVFSLIMAIGVGLASTNLGTLSRYRMPMMPFLWVLVTVIGAAARVPSSPVSLRAATAAKP